MKKQELQMYMIHTASRPVPVHIDNMAIFFKSVLDIAAVRNYITRNRDL